MSDLSDDDLKSAAGGFLDNNGNIGDNKNQSQSGQGNIRIDGTGNKANQNTVGNVGGDVNF